MFQSWTFILEHVLDLESATGNGRALEYLEKYQSLETSPRSLIFNNLSFAEKNPMLWQLSSIFWR